MNQNAQSILTSLLLGVMVIALLSYSDWEQWFESDAVTETEESQPDLVTYAVEQLKFNAQGEKHFLLKADEIQQFISADRNRIIHPDLLLFHDQQPAWKSTANEGHSDSQGEEIHLQGDVLIEQLGKANPATLETATLTISATDSHATTDDKVIIRQTGIYIEALGLEADLKNNQLTLKSQVTSIYEPEKS